VPSLTGLTVSEATTELKKENLTIRTVGDGGTVTDQIPPRVRRSPAVRR
jgi:stage V sporulation protein D (sporulation-specific penicillin-binding protein)